MQYWFSKHYITKVSYCEFVGLFLKENGKGWKSEMCKNYLGKVGKLNLQL